MFKYKKCISDRNGNVMKIRTLLSENDLDPKLYLVNNILPPLSNIKEMFLAHIHVIMTIFKLEKGTISYKGNVLNI